ncbi:hypothetical protein [Rhizobium tubonense]|uniref:hypothetical protein n=1 Tax=Rhizobium tubonense TaxID=484088 RepID=UPI001FCEA19E|nr:hypothetical protein [Rhizobium tubonense]
MSSIRRRSVSGRVEGDFHGRKWGSTIKRSDDGRRIWLYAEELAGVDVISFNLYTLSEKKSVLKPCEMSSENAWTDDGRLRHASYKGLREVKDNAAVYEIGG